MFQLIIDILHLVLAGAMSLIGIEYDRAPDCDPVQVEPAAYYEIAGASAASGTVYLLAPAAPSAAQPVSDCATAPASVSLPRPRVRIEA